MRIPHNDPLGSDISGGPQRPARPGSADADPQRKCVLSGRIATRDTLIRLAIAPEGTDGACAVLPDVLARAPGRGAWIGVTRAELATAVAKGKLKGALARAFKGSAFAIPDDLPDRIEAALTRAFAERLGLELRAGRLLMGSDRIAEQARAGRVYWLAHAADAGEDGNRKLDQAQRVGQDTEGSGWAGTILPLDRAALSVALGRDNVVHLALSDRGAALRTAALLDRLLHFRGEPFSAASDAATPELNDRGANRAAPAPNDDDLSLKGCVIQ